MDDDDRIPPHELEQLVGSLSIDGSLGRHDAQLVAQALRRLARFEAQATKMVNYDRSPADRHRE